MISSCLRHSVYNVQRGLYVSLRFPSFYDKFNPPTPLGHPSGLRTQGVRQLKENPRPEPLPGIYFLLLGLRIC